LLVPSCLSISGCHNGYIHVHPKLANIYPNINCTIYYTQSIDTWPYLLLACTNPNIHRLRIKKHTNAIWELHKLFLSNKTFKCLTLINAGYNNNKAQDNNFHHWLLPCICPLKLCQCNARLKPNIFLLLNHL
jgi:hypothetical protein